MFPALTLHASGRSPPVHPARLPVDELLRRCDERRLRRGGPGGQHRNKVETAVLLTHTPTGVAAEANERRSQQQNRVVATRRLRVRLAVEHREPLDAGRRDGEPSELWRRRSAGGRLRVNPTHDDFPALLAEALDRVAAADWDEAAAAAALGVSRSQLIRLLAAEPAALETLNRERASRGRRSVR